MNAPLRVGVTGGIGSGKSALTERLAAFGVEIVDADVIAREVVAPGSEALTAIAKRYGSNVLQTDGALDRAALRKIVFQDEDERRWLEALTHPLIGKRIAERLAGASSAYVVLVSPLLLEGSQRDLVDHVVVVDVPEDLQIRRTTARDDNPESLVRRIMAAQLERSQRRAMADSVIDNSGSLEDLERQARRLHEELMALATQ